MSQLPELFLDRMKAMLSDEYEEFYEGFQGIRYSAFRLNPHKENEEEFWNIVREMEDFPEKEEIPWEKNGYYYDREKVFPGKHPFHEAGVYYIQEPSAMSPVPFLKVQPTDRVLDLCAAPGGKSTQIASYLGKDGFLVTNEIHPQRAKILSENIERMGIQNALVLNETPEKLSGTFEEYFDKILVDAPCSGEGMFRKNDNAGDEWSLANVENCAERQKEILDCAAQMLKQGGRIVYSTCTFAPNENEESIFAFLSRHPEFEPVEIGQEELFDGMEYGRDFGSLLKEKGWGDVCSREELSLEEKKKALKATVRIWPHKVKGEGHFFAVLQKKGETIGEVQARNGLEKGKAVKDYKELEEFLKDTLTEEGYKEITEGRILAFGEQLYRIPKDMPALQKLKVLRPGLHLGTLKKNRFEPSHALALALSKGKVQKSYEANLLSGECKSYLEGMTLTVDPGEYTKKGWYLITVCGYSMGFAKLAGGVMKNHYPKGLRK